MGQVPELVTNRLILRGPTAADIPSYERHFVDWEVVRHLSSGVPWPYPEGGIEDFMLTKIIPRQGQDRWFWGLFLKDRPDELIGGIELWREGRPEHRGFWLGHAFWGRGLMTEAATAVTDCAFDVLGFEILIFSNAQGNVRSRRVKEKTGARLLYTEPAGFHDPNYCEHEIWELTKEDWRAYRSQGDRPVC